MILQMADLTDNLSEWETIKFAASKSELKPTLNYRKFDAEKLEIILMGDMHMGSKYYDEDMHKEVIDYCLKKKTQIILMGDQIEAATRDSVGAGVYEQSEIIDKQLEHFNHLMKPLANEGLILGMHAGNHEMRLYKSSGLDITKFMAKQLKVKYFSWGKLHYFVVGKQGYKLYTTHGASGTRLAWTKIKSVLDLSNLADAEIYAMGHLHQLSHHIRNFYSEDLKNKTVIEEQKHFILTGSYLNHWGSYAHMKNYEPMRKGSPKIKLGGNEHSIRVSI